jgi:ribosomal subunit interface protein
MNIKITSRKFKARESLKDFVQNEVKSLNKYHDNILDVDVVLSYQNTRESLKIAEINLHIPGRSFFADEETDDFEKSVSSAVGKITKQLKTLKSKRTTRGK